MQLKLAQALATVWSVPSLALRANKQLRHTYPEPLPQITLTRMNPNPKRHSFPIARLAWEVAKRALTNWRARHQHPLNFGIHLIGIPLTLVGLVLLFVLEWYWGVGLFVLGYALQFIGHWVEGNDVGELIPIKRALGLKVIAVVPRQLPQSTMPLAD